MLLYVPFDWLWLQTSLTASPRPLTEILRQIIITWTMNRHHRDLESWSTGELLALVARLGERAWREFLGNMGVSMASFQILKALYEGPVSQVELAVRCRVGPQSLGRTLDRLERDGLVRRERNRSDRRQMAVARTPAGDDVVARVMANAMEGSAQFFGCLPDQDRFRADLLQLIKMLSETLRTQEEQTS
jgi:MarR family transcriptional regulator, organic hydroperoxide resistance regulator